MRKPAFNLIALHDQGLSRLQICRHVLHIWQSHAVRNDLHHVSLGPLVGSLKYIELLDQIVGMLPGQTRKLIAAFTLCTVTTHAWRDTLGWKPILVKIFACRDTSIVGSCCRQWFLPPKIIRQSYDLAIRQASAQAPHILKPGGIGAVVTAKSPELRHQIILLLSREPGKIGRHGISIQAVAIGANLLC